MLASAIGTFFGNPWTFLFIWVSDYRLGIWLLQQSGKGDQFPALNLQQLAEVMTIFMHFFIFSDEIDWQQLAEPFEQVFLPMTIGGTVLAVLSWFVAFVLCYYSFEWWRAHRAKRLANGSKVARSRKKPVNSGLISNENARMTKDSTGAIPHRVRLGVNIDHVATIRNARGGAHPSPLAAALQAEAAGADGITAHLREDRRHIRDDDMVAIKAGISVPLNFELAATSDMIAYALKISQMRRALSQKSVKN